MLIDMGFHGLISGLFTIKAMILMLGISVCQRVTRTKEDRDPIPGSSCIKEGILAIATCHDIRKTNICKSSFAYRVPLHRVTVVVCRIYLVVQSLLHFNLCDRLSVFSLCFLARFGLLYIVEYYVAFNWTPLSMHLSTKLLVLYK